MLLIRRLQLVELQLFGVAGHREAVPDLEHGQRPEEPANEQRDAASERRPVLRAVIVVELDGLAQLVVASQVLCATLPH